MVKLVEFITDANVDLESEELPYDISQDLIVYMRNEPMFYRKHLYPALIDVQAAVQKGGKYNKKQMLPVIEKGLQAYVNRYGIKKPAEELMNDQEKLECISNLLADEQDNFRQGAY